MDQQPSAHPDIAVLVKEYERVSADIRTIEGMNDKVVGFGLTLVGAGFAYGVQQNLVEVFFFLPIALIGVMLYALLQYHNMFWFGGYKRAIEDRINQLSGHTVVCWEGLVARRRAHPPHQHQYGCYLSHGRVRRYVVQHRPHLHHARAGTGVAICLDHHSLYNPGGIFDLADVRGV